MGCTHSTPGTYPQIAKDIGFINKSEICNIAESVVTTQRDFGNRTETTRGVGATCDGVRAVFAGGWPTPMPNVIDYFTIDRKDNATDFGDLSAGRGYAAGCSNGNRGVFGGGLNPVFDTIDFVVIGNTANATDFGELVQARSSPGSCSDGSRGVWAGGDSPNYDTIDIVALGLANGGGATDFGELITGASGRSGASGD